MAQNNKLYPLVRNMGIAVTIPMVFLAGPVVGFLIGYWLDQKFGWDPWAKTLLSLLGFVASIKQVIDLIKRITNENKS